MRKILSIIGFLVSFSAHGSGALEEILLNLESNESRCLIRKTDGIVTVEMRSDNPAWVSELTGNRKENRSSGYGAILAVFEADSCQFFRSEKEFFFECFEEDELNLVDIYYQNKSGPDLPAHQILRVRTQRIFLELAGNLNQSAFQISKKVILKVMLKGETYIRTAEITF